MTLIKDFTREKTVIDADGNEDVTRERFTTKIEQSKEPDYIKIYTKMWLDFNQIPERWHPLFWQLVVRMSYCNTGPGSNGGQLVPTSKPFGDEICRNLGWKVTPGKSNINLMQGLKALCECNAIRKVGRGVYQINPSYAAKGEWKYSPKADRGGVEDLIAVFKFKDKDVKAEIVWQDDNTDHPLNDSYRKALGVKKGQDGQLATITATPKPKAAPEEAPITGDVPF